MCSAAVFIIPNAKVSMTATLLMLLRRIVMVTMMNRSAAVYRGGGAGAGRRTSWEPTVPGRSRQQQQ